MDLPASGSSSTEWSSTSEAAAGSKRKREPAEQRFNWQGLPLEIKRQIVEKSCTFQRLASHTGIRTSHPLAKSRLPPKWHYLQISYANDTALDMRLVNREFATLVRQSFLTVFHNTNRRTNWPERTYSIRRFVHNGEYKTLRHCLVTHRMTWTSW